jgi:hypothetical protein
MSGALTGESSHTVLGVGRTGVLVGGLAHARGCLPLVCGVRAAGYVQGC